MTATLVGNSSGTRKFSSPGGSGDAPDCPDERPNSADGGVEEVQGPHNVNDYYYPHYCYYFYYYHHHYNY